MPEANLKELQLAAIELSSEISSEAQAVGRAERGPEAETANNTNQPVDLQTKLSDAIADVQRIVDGRQLTPEQLAANKEKTAAKYRIMHKDHPYEDERPIPIPVMAVPGYPEHLLVCRTSLIRMVAALNSDIARTLKMYNDGLEKITERVGNHLDKSLGELLIGDIVQRRDAHNMRSGASAYGGAVVISVDPYIMVSQSGDMRWSCEEAKDYFRVGIASDEQVAICMRRLEN